MFETDQNTADVCKRLKTISALAPVEMEAECIRLLPIERLASAV